MEPGVYSIYFPYFMWFCDALVWLGFFDSPLLMDGWGGVYARLAIGQEFPVWEASCGWGMGSLLVDCGAGLVWACNGMSCL
jgi:hypothetical protein